jgi:type IV pilus assembly protein PilZ
MEPDIGALAGTILEVHLQDSEALAAAYLPFLQLGGLFVPTAGTYRLGEEVRLRVVLHEEALQDLIPGKVAWITPTQAVGNRAAGVGLHFTADEACRLLNKKIEGLVAGLAAAALVLGG